MLEGNQLEQLVDQIRPELVEHIWAEPYNDRHNWWYVRKGYTPGSYGYRWMTDVYERGRRDLWSKYATELHARLREKAGREGWLHKLKYLLYEDQITPEDAAAFEGLDGVLLQSKPAADGLSRNPAMSAIQAASYPS